MPAPSPGQRSANRGGSADPPLKAFKFSPLPARVVTAFPELAEWLKQQQQIVDENSRQNNVALGR